MGGWGSLSQPRLNIFTVGNMRVMICLSQGGLRSLSASSFVHNFNALYFFCIAEALTWTFLNCIDEG